MKSCYFLVICLLIWTQIDCKLQFDEAEIIPPKLFFCKGLERELRLVKIQDEVQIACHENVMPKINNSVQLNVTISATSQALSEYEHNDAREIMQLMPIFEIIRTGPSTCSDVLNQCISYKKSIDFDFNCTCDFKTKSNEFSIGVEFSIADFYKEPRIFLMYFAPDLSDELYSQLSPTARRRGTVPTKAMTELQYCRHINGFLHSNTKLTGKVNASCTISPERTITWKTFMPTTITGLGEIITMQFFENSIYPNSSSPYIIPIHISCNFFEKKIADLQAPPENFEMKCIHLEPNTLLLEMSFKLTKDDVSQYGRFAQESDYEALVQMNVFTYNRLCSDNENSCTGDTIQIKHSVMTA